MKILMLIDSLGIGGAETHVCALAEELARAGSTVTVAASDGVLRERLINSKIKFIRLPSIKKPPISRKIQECRNKISSKMCTDALTSCIIFNILKAHFQICAIIKHYRPDIVHAHTRRMAFIVAPLCKAAKIPLITTAHAMFSMKGLRAPLSVWGNETIAVSEDIKEHILKHSKIRKSNIHVIYNGIKTQSSTQ